MQRFYKVMESKNFFYLFRQKLRQLTSKKKRQSNHGHESDCSEEDESFLLLDPEEFVFLENNPDLKQYEDNVKRLQIINTTIGKTISKFYDVDCMKNIDDEFNNGFDTDELEKISEDEENPEIIYNKPEDNREANNQLTEKIN